MSKEMYYQITLVSLAGLHLLTYTLNFFDGIPKNNMTLFLSSCFLLLLFSGNLMYGVMSKSFPILKLTRKCLILVVIILCVALVLMYIKSPSVFLNNKVIILMVCLFYFALETLTLSLFIHECDVPDDDKVTVEP
jgi:peptidoglycan/LPS O-acetylase OafA/YrhL